jgi:ABC-type antimicrobial peptide transport system permease subunit
MSHAVAQRTQEIGVRLALGASPADVRSMIVGAGLRTAGVGLGIGLVASFAVTRLLGSLLYGVSPVDPASLAATAVVLLATALLASGVAALRAGRIDPLQALHCE